MESGELNIVEDRATGTYQFLALLQQALFLGFPVDPEDPFAAGLGALQHSYHRTRDQDQQTCPCMVELTHFRLYKDAIRRQAPAVKRCLTVKKTLCKFTGTKLV